MQVTNIYKHKGFKGRLLVSFVVTILLLIGVAANMVNAAFTPGGSVGPVNPNTGFPNWYMDQNGLALDLMEAADPFGISDPVDPMNPFSQQVGFNAEGFWWAADASVTGPTGVDASLVLAMEASFAGEAAVNGEQSAFGRVRVRVSGLTTGETYVVKHPFGTQTFVAEAVSPSAPTVGRINFTSDIGCFATGFASSCDPNIPVGNPNNFGLALNSNIGPFLTWNTFNTDAALSDPALINSSMPGKRYVGNPTIDHAIKGSPVGQNFFRIEGPNVGGPGINFLQTDLFAVVGRVAVVDTATPIVVSTSPASVAVGSTNVVLSSNITDDVAVRSATVDLGSLGNTFTANLNGSQEVPSTASVSTGLGTFTIDTTANTLSFNISATGATDANDLVITGMHIHGSTTTPGGVGQNAPVAFSLGTALPAVGVWNYPEEMESEILSGRTYVNIHTALFPNGKIRGQILHDTNVQNMTMTAGTQTNGTWGVVISGPVSRLGSFNLPIIATDGSNTVNATHTLSVMPSLTSVSITGAAGVIGVGATQQLAVSASDQAGNPIASGLSTTWSSDNSLVATVDANGLVTGVGAGTATVTATVTNGLNTVSGTSAVSVSASPLPVCQTGADADGDGSISNLEILNYVRSWKSGSVSNLLLLQAIGFWKAGAGC